MSYMDLLTAVARDVIAGVLALSGIAKLFTGRGGSQELLHVWRLPRFMQRGIEVGLPWLECLLTVALIAGWQLQWVGWIIVSLFLLFTLTVALNLVKGQRVPCNCFGAWSQEPVGTATLFRNVLLFGLAVGAFLPWRLRANPADMQPLFSAPVLTHLLALVVILTGMLVGQMLFFRRGLRGELRGTADIIGGNQ